MVSGERCSDDLARWRRAPGSGPAAGAGELTLQRSAPRVVTLGAWTGSSALHTSSSSWCSWRFYFGGQFDDDDPSVDKDLAVASEVFTAVASGKHG
jgi:hypothetical protein